MIVIDLSLRRGTFSLQVQAALGSACSGIFGPSGSGKSSLLLALAGLLPVEQVRVELAGTVLVDHAAGLVPPAHQRRIGVVFQDHRLFPHLRVRDNLRYGLRGDGPSWNEVIDLLDIAELLDRRPDQCSGGQRQRIAIGRALLSAPRLLLLDEPLANLDRDRKTQILPYLRRVKDRFGIPLLMVSHDLEDLLTVVDELLVLDQGHVMGCGSLEQLCAVPALLPRLHAGGLVCPLSGTVRSASAGHLVVHLDGPGTTDLLCLGPPAQPGERVEVLLRPDDLIIARPPVSEALSVSNRLPGTIVTITRSPERCLVAVDIGAVRPVLADLVGSAVDRLGLAEGESVLVLAKAQAVQSISLHVGTHPAT